MQEYPVCTLFSFFFRIQMFQFRFYFLFQCAELKNVWVPGIRKQSVQLEAVSNDLCEHRENIPPRVQVPPIKCPPFSPSTKKKQKHRSVLQTVNDRNVIWMKILSILFNGRNLKLRMPSVKPFPVSAAKTAAFATTSELLRAQSRSRSPAACLRVGG